MSKEAKYLFVGENPSKTARDRGWTWESGRLAAKQLFEALIENNLYPQEQIFINLFYKDWRVSKTSLELIDAGLLEGVEVVAMGQKVGQELSKRSVPHIQIVHPAARGAIRKKERYFKHIQEKLSL